jgi:hypothetical protein
MMLADFNLVHHLASKFPGIEQFGLVIVMVA